MKMDHNESYWTRKFNEHMRTEHPSFLKFKIADHFTHGIPDSVIIHENICLWLELKVLKLKELIVDRVYKDELQLHTMHRIEQATGHAWYMIFVAGKNMSFLMLRPSEIIEAKKNSGEFNFLISNRYYNNFSWVGEYFKRGGFSE